MTVWYAGPDRAPCALHTRQSSI